MTPKRCFLVSERAVARGHNNEMNLTRTARAR